MGRRLGQHFLSDPAILDRIVQAIDPQPDDVVLEIGTGRGSLTRRLASHVGRVVTIEKDRALAAAWSAASPATPDNVELIVGDALKLDWQPLLTRDSGPLAVKVIGNVPYAITSPLIDQALSPPPPEVVVFLVQRELADRLAAAPGTKTYGGLSVGVQATAAVERLFTVPAGAFHPPPKVHSAVVRLVPRVEPLVSPEEHAGFRRFVTAVFSQRRKQLVRILRSVVKLEREEAERLVGEVALAPTARPETLTPTQFVELYRATR